MNKKSNQTCQRCQSTFECKTGDIANCQCATITISEETQKYLTTTNYGCLCTDCLIEINGKIKKETN